MTDLGVDIAFLSGLALIVAGVAVLSVPAALISAGVLMTLASVGAARSGGDN
jgi:hypothetical protein